MKILITERQIRLILQEAIDYKDAEEYLKTDRSENIEERLNNVYESLKSNPEFISSNRNGERLYFEFGEDIQIKNKVKNIHELGKKFREYYYKVNAIITKKGDSKKTYTLVPELFLQNKINVNINIPEEFRKKDEYGKVIPGSDKKIQEQSLVSTLMKLNIDKEIKKELDEFFDEINTTKEKENISQLYRYGYFSEEEIKQLDGYVQLSYNKLNTLQDKNEKLVDFVKELRTLNTQETKETKENLMIVISRAKYDLAGMSGNREWQLSSCMRIPTKQNNKNKGGFCSRIINDIQEGTLVAYVIKSDDKNIEKPIARMLIKPFEGNYTVFYKPEEKIYGNYNKDILYKYLVDLLKPVNKDSKEYSYIKNEKLYDDDKITGIYNNKKLNDFFSKKYEGSSIDYIINNILNDSEIIEIFDKTLIERIIKEIPIDSRSNFFIKYIIPNKLIMKKISEIIYDKFSNIHDLMFCFKPENYINIISALVKNENSLSVLGIKIFDFIYLISDEQNQKINILKELFYNNIEHIVKTLNISYFTFYQKTLAQLIDYEDKFNFVIENIFKNNEYINIDVTNIYYFINYYIGGIENKAFVFNNYILNNKEYFNKIVNNSTTIHLFIELFKENKEIMGNIMVKFIDNNKNYKNLSNALKENNITDLNNLPTFINDLEDKLLDVRIPNEEFKYLNDIISEGNVIMRYFESFFPKITNKE